MNEDNEGEVEGFWLKSIIKINNVYFILFKLNIILLMYSYIYILIKFDL